MIRIIHSIRIALIMLMQTFSKVDNEGKVVIPAGMLRAAKLEKGQQVVLRISGAGTAPSVIVTPARKTKRGKVRSIPY